MSQTAIAAALRKSVAARAHYCCSYCLTQEEVVGMQFTVDHIIAESLGGQTVAENLCLACWDCNLIKITALLRLTPIQGPWLPCFTPINKSGLIILLGWNRVQSS